MQKKQKNKIVSVSSRLNLKGGNKGCKAMAGIYDEQGEIWINRKVGSRNGRKVRKAEEEER